LKQGVKKKEKNVKSFLVTKWVGNDPFQMKISAASLSSMVLTFYDLSKNRKINIESFKNMIKKSIIFVRQSIFDTS